MSTPRLVHPNQQPRCGNRRGMTETSGSVWWTLALPILQGYGVSARLPARTALMNGLCLTRPPVGIEIGVAIESRFRPRSRFRASWFLFPVFIRKLYECQARAPLQQRVLA